MTRQTEPPGSLPPSHFEGLKCIQINLRHSKAASASLSQLVLEREIDIVLIQEPYAVFSSQPFLANVPSGYSSFHHLSSDHAYGAAIIVKNSLVSSCKIEAVGTENHATGIVITTASGPLYFWSLYIRPTHSSPIPVLTPLLSNFHLSRTVLAMDSNCKNKSWNSPFTDAKGEELEALIADNCLNIVNVPRAQLDFVPGNTLFLDLTLAGDKVRVSHWRFLSTPSCSDHPYVYFEVMVSPPVRRGVASRCKRVPPVSQLNLSDLKKCISSKIDLHPAQTVLASETALETRISNLSSLISASAHQCKLPATNCRFNRAMPWWNASLAILRSKTRAAYKTWSGLKTSSNKVVYNECKAEYQRELRRAKSNSFKLLCAKSSDKEIFSTLRSLCGKKNLTSHPSAVEINGHLTTEPASIIAACTAHFFPSSLPSDEHHTEIERGVDALLSSSDPAPIPPITFEEFQLAVQSLNRKSAPGLDGLTSEILMDCLPPIKSQLLNIMNSCFQLETFPEIWKRSKVLIIGKPNKASYNSLKSFRPITLVNSMSKILEKLILNRLTWLAKTQSWLCDSQHGFMEGRSTETAAQSLISCIESAFSAKESAACAFLDIKSAFDSAWHPAILAALAKRSCPVYLIKLVKSFLHDRQATISLEACSTDIKINLGCPQGGVLSPFLWIILIDDALRATFDFPFRLVAYADDLTAITWHKDPAIATRNLQKICDFIAAWCKKTKLTINALKTIFMIFSRRHSKRSDLRLKLGYVDVVPSAEATFLGFILDSRLTWYPHVNFKTAAARRAMLAVHGCLRASWGQDSVKLRQLYTLVVEPILLYGCSVWASFIKTKSGVKRLRSFQRFVNRLITRSLGTAPTDSLLIISNTLPIEMRIAEITALRFACRSMDVFSTSSLDAVAPFLPNGYKNTKLDRPALPYLINFPPWKLAF